MTSGPTPVGSPMVTPRRGNVSFNARRMGDTFPLITGLIGMRTLGRRCSERPEPAEEALFLSDLQPVRSHLFHLGI